MRLKPPAMSPARRAARYHSATLRPATCLPDAPRTTLAAMNTRAMLVVGAVLALPAWSQEPVLDLSAETIRKIARETAATQYAEPQLTEARRIETKPETPPEKVVRYVPPEKPSAKQVAKLNLPAMPPALQGGFVSALIDTLVSEALGTDSYNDPVETNTVSWLTCQSAIDLKRETFGQKSCRQ